MIYFFPFFSFWVKDFLEPLKGSQAAVQSPLQSKESMQGSSHPMALPDLSVSVNRVVSKIAPSLIRWWQCLPQLSSDRSCQKQKATFWERFEPRSHFIC